MATLGMYILSIIGAIFIDEVGVIFEFVGAISSSTISFIIPGYFYIATEKLYGNKLLGNIWTRRISFVFIVLGIIIFFLLFIGSIFNLADSNVE
jgi:amino acid permease